ncbi:hypothetical protein APE01nite_08260 [Acetobacter peroxydans]|uniref:Uncharacterized protein n=1 Tax=Acetobacter peroxydans TaxID=104098 RepID=A0A4Y3TU66_9PROT|nr:hypothetical protein AA13755_1159 [Acetobacter peroxydans NBRC 13755]GBR41035.1 hypothetical protein AA0475_0890 [Acetobacter peroxydans]GEB85029.1 hypothetical protein APE01nite_08260 [Acetobacter peroxydans]
MQKDLFFAVIGLATTDYKLVVFLSDLQILHTKTGDSKRDPQSILGDLFDIVGRIAISRPFSRPFEHLFKMVEPQKHGRPEKPA